jgi:N-acetylglucosaminyldiphosphoundecaprenol N-acetyl-beta-D-mannosaminyltransferase
MSVSPRFINNNEIHPYRESARGVRNVLVILGTPIDAVTMEGALDRIDELVTVGRATGRTHQIATVNADFVVKALSDPQLRRILQDADMATADGMPLVWGARMLGVPIKSRVTGVDMVNRMAERAALRGYSLYLLGAAPGVAQRAAEILCARYPGLRIVGVASPSQQAVAGNDPAIIATIRAANPDILLVAFGNPKQEKWIHTHTEQLCTPVMMGVGGTFDFVAGVTKRAPRWMQDTGLEWLHRLLQEPRRLWRRYAVDLVGFGFYFLWQWWVMRRLRRPVERVSTPVLKVVGETTILNVTGSLDASNHGAFAELADAALSQRPYLVINLAQAEFLDSSAIGTLVALTKKARGAGGNVWLAATPPALTRILSMLRLEQFLDLCEDLDRALALSNTYRAKERA